MTWRDRLNLEGAGSFKGVEFYVGSVSSTVGRSKIIHKFPGRKYPLIVDDGGLAREFDFQCFIIGPDYDIQRNKLRDAFESEGSGILVHPYWGEFEVEVTSPVSIQETTTEGGMCRFSLKMIEVGASVLTTATPDLPAQVDLKADATVAAAAAELADGYDVSDLPASLIQSTINAINDIASKIRKARGYINTALGIVDDVGTAIDDIVDGATALAQAASSISSTFSNVIGSVMGAVNALETGLASVAGVFGVESGDFQGVKVLDAMRELSDLELDTIPDSSSALTDTEQENQRLIDNLVRQIAVTEGSRALVKLDLESRDFVLNAREEVNTIFDGLLLTAGDTAWQSLVDLKSAFSQAMLEKAQDLPDITEFELQTTVPALVTAFNVYGDSTKDLEIVGRNAIQDPNFVRGGTTLRVVLDD